MSEQDLTTATVRGVGWTAGAQVAKQVAQIALSIVVARLLAPSAFGQVAQVLVISGIGNLVSDFGLGAALVQRKELDEAHRSSVFWLQLVLGVAVALILAAAAGPVAAFYRDAGLRPLTLVLAPNVLLLSIGTVQRSLLTRAMRFRVLALIDVSTLVIGGAVCIALAATGAGVMSIAVSNIANSAATALMLWVATSWRPSLQFDRSAVRELLPFSRNLLGFSFVNYAIRNTDNLLVGRLLGATALGLYTRGYSILLYPNRQVSGVIGRVMFASMSRMHDDVDRLRRVYLRTIGVIALVTFPAMAGLAIVAHDFVLVVLGPQWLPAVPIIRIFCVLGASESIAATIGWIYQSTGRTDVLFRWAIVTGGAPLLGIVVGARMGTIHAVTVGYAVCTTVLLYPAFRIAGRLIGMRFADVVRTVAGAAMCTFGMVAVVVVATAVTPDEWARPLSLVLRVAVGAVAFVGLAHVGRVRAYCDLRDVAVAQLERRRGRDEPATAAPAGAVA